MVDNVDRAEWAEAALELFAGMVMPGEVSEETAQDLICDVGRSCLIQLRLSRSEVLALYAAGRSCACRGAIRMTRSKFRTSNQFALGPGFDRDRLTRMQVSSG
jgi:hypothetical protein